MREAKRSRSGWSNRTVPKSKKTNASHSFIRNQFLGDFNRKHGIGLIILSLIVIGGIGGYYLYQTPAFHSYVCVPTEDEILRHLPCGDPFQDLWTTQNFPSSGGEWSMLNTVYKSNCDASSGNCLSLLSNSSYPALALSKQPIGLDTIGRHELFIAYNYCFDSAPNNNGNRWEIFLSRNGTMPSGISASAYRPKSDVNVALVLEVQDTGSGNVNAFGWNQRLQTQTIQSGDISGGQQGSGTLFLSLSGTQNTNSPCTLLRETNIAMILNYTGASPSTSGVKSEIDIAPQGGVSSQTFQTLSPWFEFQSTQYFIGFYMEPCSSCAAIDFPDTTTGKAIHISRLDPPIPLNQIPASPPNLDTGGWFGPVARWFINGAIFIFQNIINFFAYLGSILSPVLAGVIALFSGVFIAIFNALGGIFGDNQLGTQIGTFFSNLSSYLTNVFSLAITIIAGIAGPNGLLSNAVQIAINFLSGSNSFIGVLVTLATGLAGLIPILSGFWTLLVSLFNLGIAGADFIIIIMLVLLEFAAITDWIQDDNPIDALVAIPLAFFLFYFLANAPSSINIIALNTSISSNYLTAWNNIVWFVKLFPVIFFTIFFEWASSLDETARFHRQTTILHNFFSVVKFYRLLTVDVIMGSWWFFDNAYDMITKGLTAIKGRWSPVEVAGTG